MAWLPISNTVLQYVDVNGVPYSGAVLKFYAAGTSTNIPVATSQTGTPTVTSVALNSSGFPAVSGNVVVLFIDQDFKVALYPTQAAADSNTGALWTIDNIDPFAVLTLPNNLSDINALSPADGTIIVGDGTGWVAESGATARTSLGLGTGDSPQFTNVTLTGLTTGHIVLANSAGALTALDLTAKGSIVVGDGAGAPVALAVGTNAHVLTADSAAAAGVKWAALPGVASDLQTFTSSGTWTKPPSALFVLVELWSGGGGGSCSTGAAQVGGGGGGEYVYKLFQASALAATETVTIGAGGEGGVAGAANNGSAGGNTTFGSLLTATGGNPGVVGAFFATIPRSNSATAATGSVGQSFPATAFSQSGYGGSSSAGGKTIYGGGGGGGNANAGGTSAYGGNGGAGTDTLNTAATAGTAPGGGGGGSGNGGAGGAGARGEARVWTW